MSRRKGERPVLKPLMTLTPDSPVVRCIADGDRWFQAWMMQECTPLPKLVRVTGIPAARIDALSRGGRVSRAEIDALARVWCVGSADLISTMPDPSLLVE